MSKRVKVLQSTEALLHVVAGRDAVAGQLLCSLVATPNGVCTLLSVAALGFGAADVRVAYDYCDEDIFVLAQAIDARDAGLLEYVAAVRRGSVVNWVDAFCNQLEAVTAC